MSVYLDVVRPCFFCPNTDRLYEAMYRDNVGSKEFALNIVGFQWEVGLVRPREIRKLATRIIATHPALSETLQEIARYGGMIQIS